MSTTFSFPLTPLEKQAKTHAILMSVAFLIILPIGALGARYARTYTAKWFWPHMMVQFFVAGPIIYAGWALGYKTSTELGQGQFIDTHQKCGLALLILYLIQIFIGALAHFVKFPRVYRGHREPFNYLHLIIGIAIFILAAYQSHYGLYIEWDLALGGSHHVPSSAKHAWLALIVIFWVLFALGMGLLPRQLRQESDYRARINAKASGDHIAKVENNGSG